MSFGFPVLAWLGLPLIGLPILIHLINMLRHKRVQWAAMEFLLQSQRKNRTWVILKQLLLLLLRIAAVAAVVMIVAQPRLQNELGGLFGSTTTHHIVLLDDSYSMSDRHGGETAFDRAKSVVERIGLEATRPTSPQLFTLLRFSNAERAGTGTEADLVGKVVNSEFADLLADLLRPIDSTQLAIGPSPAFEAIDQLLGEQTQEERVVYLVSDFRNKDWESSAELQSRLAELNERNVAIHFVNCVDAVGNNLAIQAVEPASGTLAADMVLDLDVSVANYGQAPARNVPLSLVADGNVQPALQIPAVPAGQSVVKRVQVHFPTAGYHDVSLQLGDDPIGADNGRSIVLNLPLGGPTLLCAGAADAADARAASTALAPADSTTGVQPQIEQPVFLAENDLAPFRVVYVFNVSRLERQAVAALERFVESGGGVCFFVGDNTRAAFVNDELYKNGEGLFPLPLGGMAELLVDRLDTAPDVQASDHPIFFKELTAPYLDLILVRKYFEPASDWTADPDSGIEILAQLRNGAPLCVEKRFGEGRVIAMLSTAAPTWNNWFKENPSYPVVFKEMQGHLARRTDDFRDVRVGEPLDVGGIDPNVYQASVRFVLPEGAESSVVTVDARSNSEGMMHAELGDTSVAGVYSAKLKAKDGTLTERRFAVNVDPSEGDLEVVTPAQLAEELDGVSYTFHQASAFRYDGASEAGINLSEQILYLMILLIIAESLLAYSASYHLPAARAARGAAR